VITASPKADVPPKPVKVLFTEDEVLLRLMVTDVLRQAGFQVFEASNGHEGVSILKTMPVDVVCRRLSYGDLSGERAACMPARGERWSDCAGRSMPAGLR
jgi:DNA-binding response OmpR family regulator